MTTPQAASPQGGGKNTLDFASLMATAIELGEMAGKGKDTQVRFYLKLVEGAFQNAITLDKDKHGTDIDDATKLAEAYVKGQSGAVVFDAKAPNQRKLVSCLRTCVKLGQWPKGGSGEPLATVNNLMTIRQKLRAQPAEAKKLDDAANTLLKYARQQLKRDHLIDEAELKTMCYKAPSTLRTAEQIVEGIRKELIQLRDGKAAGGTALDSSKEIKDAIKLMGDRLVAIAKARGSALAPGVSAIKPK